MERQEIEIEVEREACLSVLIRQAESGTDPQADIHLFEGLNASYVRETLFGDALRCPVEGCDRKVIVNGIKSNQIRAVSSVGRCAEATESIPEKG